MAKSRLFVLSLIFFVLFIPPSLPAEDLNEIAYQNRFLLKAGTILNSDGIGDCLLLPYYDVRKIDGKRQTTEINIQNMGAYGIVAKLRFRDWSRGTEIFSKDIWIPSTGTWNGKIEISSDGKNAKITSSSHVVSSYDSNAFYLSTSLSNGTLFSTRTIRRGLGESTLYGFIEVIGSEKTSPDNISAKVGRLAKSDQDCPNNLRGSVLINRVDDGASMTYNAVAIGNFSRGQGSLFRSIGSPYPRLDNGEDTLDQLEFQLSKYEIFGPFSVSPSNQAKTSLIMAFPTKYFHYSYGKRINQINNPFEALKETTGENLDTKISPSGNSPVESFVTLPFTVNVIGLYKDYNGAPLGIDNVSLQTYSYDSGEVTLTSEGIAQRILIQDYEYLQERFQMYRGVPSLGLLLHEYRDQGQLHASITPAEYSAVWEASELESVFIPTILSGPANGITNESYTYTTGGSRSSLGHPIQYLIDWGDGTNSDWLPSGELTASKTWTIGGVYTIRSRARCAFHTDVISNWSPGFTVTIITPESVSTPTVLTGPVTGIPNTNYTYTTGGSLSSYGHAVQYFFDWGDGTDSNWLPVGTTTATKFWAEGGEYSVRARARCTTDTSIISEWTTELIVKIELISDPNPPVGPVQGNIGTSYTYMTGGASSNINDPIEYRFDWGDGTFSNWQTSTTASKSWAVGGTYSVRAKARCAIHTNLESEWSDALAVTINNPAPTLTGVLPGSGNRLQTLNVVLSGTNFLSGASSVSFGAGITINTTTVNSSTQITVNITIGVTAATGPQNVSVTNAPPGGGTATLTNGFTVNNPAPTLTGISPNNGNWGDTINVVFTGTNFISGVSTVSFGSNFTINSTIVNSSTQITANITIQAGATLGPRDVSVTNAGPGGGTATLTNGFTVNNPPPTLSNISPVQGSVGTTLDVVFTGTNYFNGISSVSFSGTGITINSTTVDSSTQITANITIDIGATQDARTVSVTNAPPGGGTVSGTNWFLVVP
jgi:ribosomal 50S subunit-recycling heat shock protein